MGLLNELQTENAELKRTGSDFAVKEDLALSKLKFNVVNVRFAEATKEYGARYMLDVVMRDLVPVRWEAIYERDDKGNERLKSGIAQHMTISQPANPFRDKVYEGVAQAIGIDELEVDHALPKKAFGPCYLLKEGKSFDIVEAEDAKVFSLE